MNAEQLLSALEHRGYQVRLHPKGGFTIVPTSGLTNDEREDLKHSAADLERLLREREEAHARGLSPRDARVIDQVTETFPGSTVVEIRPGIPTTPARPKRVRKAAVDQQILKARTADNSQTTEQANPTRQVPKPLPSDSSSTERALGDRDGNSRVVTPELVVTTVRICPRCQHPCYDLHRTHCQNCDAEFEAPPASTPETDSRSTEVTSDRKAVGKAIGDLTLIETEVLRELLYTDEAIATLSSQQAREIINQAIAGTEPELKPKALAADAAGNPEQSPDETSLPASSPVYQAEKILLWVTIRRVRIADDRGIELELEPSPDTDTAGIRFFIEGGDPSVRSHFQSGTPWLVNDWLDHDGYQLFHPANGLRLGIEIER
jgi:hypothetical protein